jgi:hypothetical protein
MMGRLACERRLTLSIRACAIAALHRDCKLTARAVWSALSENAELMLTLVNAGISITWLLCAAAT